MTLTTQNKSRATGDVRTALLVIGFLLFCIVGWVISWRTAQSWFVYFLTPILILVIAISVVPLLASGIMMGGKASRWAFLGLAIMVLYGSKMLWSSWPEIHWGAPKLLAVTGSVLSFEEGQQHKLPLRDLTVQGEETLRKKNWSATYAARDAKCCARGVV